MSKKYTVEYLKDNGLILLDAISGSRSYHTHIPESDWDYRGIYIAELNDFLCGDYPEQVSDKTNDVTYYEIGRFFELLIKNNPNILELLNIPEDCIEFRHDLIDLIDSNDYVSKLCKNSIGGYATSQIKKARGLGKKIVTPVDEVRKTPLDFCNVIDGHKTMSLEKFMEEKGMEQLFCGVVDVPNARDTFALYYDWQSHYCFSEKVDKKTREAHKSARKEFGEAMGLGYKGLMSLDSNTIRLSSIPKSESDNVVCTFSYNKDSYTQHCKSYKEYWDWVEARNPQRYKVAAEAQYDAKNMMHCYRLAEMGIEIAEGKGVIVRRPNREFLLKIRNGELGYEEILSLSEGLLEKSDEAFSKSNLRSKPDTKKAKETEVEIRRKFYNIEKSGGFFWVTLLKLFKDLF
jgi:hypothetical protein